MFEEQKGSGPLGSWEGKVSNSCLSNARERAGENSQERSEVSKGVKRSPGKENDNTGGRKR